MLREKLIKKQKENFCDYAFLNGNVITVDQTDTIYEAIGIKDNKILWVGSNEEVKEFVNEDTVVYDIKGKTIMPGINDTHFHPILSGLLGPTVDSGMIDTTNKNCPTLTEMFNKIRGALKTRGAGEWISMMGYEPMLFEDEKRHPTLQELDEIAPDNPVHCMHGGGHICMYNSKALEYLEIYSAEDAKKFPKDEVEVIDGKLTGQLRGHTHFKLWGKVEYTEEMQTKAAMKSYQAAIENGITSVGDMGEAGKTSYRLMQQLTNDRKFKVRVSMALHSIFGKEYSLADNDHWMNLGFTSGLGNEYFRVGPSKFMIDGGSGGPSCATREPYSHDPTMVREKGWGRQETSDYIWKLYQAGNQITAHAIGDEAVEYMIEGFERCFKDDPEKFRSMRHRIEHCTLVDQDLINRMAKMNICPSVNAGLVQMLGANYMKFYGERNQYLGALKSMLEAGVMCSLHSDSPSGPIGLNTLDGAVNRYDRVQKVQCDKTQAVSVLEAIRVATYNGAYATFEEEIKGSLEPGKLADLIVLSDNILEIDPMTLNKLSVELTMIDGEIVFEA